MINDILDELKKIFQARFAPITFVYFLFFAVLIVRIFTIQIVQNDKLSSGDDSKIKEIELKSTRGNILDRNGVLLAYNKLSYSITLEDTGELETNAEKNNMIYKLITIIEKQGGQLNNDFFIQLNSKGELYFIDDGSKERNFKRDAYSVRSVDDLTQEQLNASPKEVFEFLRTGEGSKSTSMYGIDDKYSLEDTLKIMQIRYNLMLNKFEKYMPITVATNANSKTVAAINEYSSELPGVDVLNETYRVYNDSEAFAHILGYTGLINNDELNALSDKDKSNYSATDQIGKIGLEEHLEEYLHGEKGSEKIRINSNSEVEEIVEVNEPKAGDDVYLTIDSNLQKASYTLLEKKIAGILSSKLVNVKSVSASKSADDVRVPIYDVYYAFFTNGVIDVEHFTDSKAKEYEKRTYKKFLEYKKSLKGILKDKLSIKKDYNEEDFGKIQYEYVERIFEIMKDNNIILMDKMPENDSKYKKFKEGKESFSSFAKHAISNSWIDLKKINIENNSFYSTNELYSKLLDYVLTQAIEDNKFEKIIYKDMINTGKIPTNHVCILLLEQNVIKYNKDTIRKLESGSISAFGFIKNKLNNLDITPGQLGLDPCSGSVVITDVKSGDVLAMVSYPSYDNNKLANSIDSDYYSYLLGNSSSPLVNRATLTCTAPGSTYKMVTSAAGLESGVIYPGTTIHDSVSFTKIGHPARCYSKVGHGTINVVNAIGVSCNYFFYETGYRLSLENGKYNSNKGLKKLKKYASMFGFNAKSGVEVPEYSPHISTEDSVRSAIGQGNNAFAPVQIARYATTLANKGTCYNLTLIDKVQDVDGKVVLNNKATVYNEIDFKSSTWNSIHSGMRTVVNGKNSSIKRLYKDLGVDVAGKTGTAQQVKTRANHGLFVSFAPYEKPEVAVTCVIPFGYTSFNAADLAHQIYQYYFELTDTDVLIDSKVDDSNVASTQD